ncbi:MAG: hypothetical protein O7C98_02545 [Planctomycetota bacterium]|nr:hypothetical protein [Planctomycetota bacterium]
MPKIPDAPLHHVHDLPEDRVGDPREEQEWFQRLPEHAKEEMRERWRGQERHLDRIRQRSKESIVRYAVEGAAILPLFEIIFFSPGWVRFGASIIAGALMGLVCALTRAGQYRYLLIGPPFFLGMRLLFGFGPFILEAFGAVLYVSLSALLGFSHDLRKTEGLPG